MANNALLDLTSVKPIAHSSTTTTATTSRKFVSNHPPPHLGNTSPIAFGGGILAVAINSVCHTVDTEHLRLYSATGNFLGGAKTDRPLYCAVRVVRSTRTFETRQVWVTQCIDQSKVGEGKWPPVEEMRSVLIMLADFMSPEQGQSLLTFSAKPTGTWEGVEEALTTDQMYQGLVKKGRVSETEVKIHRKLFALPLQMFDFRYCRESVFSQNLFGVAKHLETTQDHLSLPDKSTMYWIRSMHPVTTYAENLISVFFNIDEATSFIPLTHSHMFLQDAGACSSLDFALRIFAGGAGTSPADDKSQDAVHLNFDEFHLKEIKCITGGQGKTYTEARLWDQHGRLVVSMTSQNILRSVQERKKEKTASL